MRLGGKVALISGGASGMGQSEAIIFAKEGAKVVVADVLEVEGRQVADGLGGAGRFVRLDVTSEAAWQEAMAATLSHFGKLDVLVNNAGISGSFDPDTLSTSAWDRLMDVNAKGVFLGMKHAIPLMKKAGGGAIVNSVHPGVLPAMRSSKATADPAFREKMLAGVPMRREGRVEEVAYAVLFLASDEASYITGTELVVDGGWLAV